MFIAFRPFFFCAVPKERNLALVIQMIFSVPTELLPFVDGTVWINISSLRDLNDVRHSKANPINQPMTRRIPLRPNSLIQLLKPCSITRAWSAT